MTTARRFNLTGALAVVAVGDLVMHRLIERLFLPQQPTGLARLASEAGRFAFHLGSVLGLALVALTLYDSLRREDIFPRSMRFAVSIVGLFFVVAAGTAVLALQAIERYTAVVHLIKTSHAFLALFIVMATWRSLGPMRAKVGVTLFALPAMLHALALFCNAMSWFHLFPTQLARTAEICALAAGALSPLLLPPTPLRQARPARCAVGVLDPGRAAGRPAAPLRPGADAGPLRLPPGPAPAGHPRRHHLRGHGDRLVRGPGRSASSGT
jgi:hypothetical protein